MIELLPCPFCGGEADSDAFQAYRTLERGDLRDAIAINCTRCQASILICRDDFPGVTVEDVALMWNTRTPPRLVPCQCAACITIEDPEMVSLVPATDAPAAPQPPPLGTMERVIWDARGGPPPPPPQKGFA